MTVARAGKVICSKGISTSGHRKGQQACSIMHTVWSKFCQAHSTSEIVKTAPTYFLRSKASMQPNPPRENEAKKGYIQPPPPLQQTTHGPTKSSCLLGILSKALQKLVCLLQVLEYIRPLHELLHSVYVLVMSMIFVSTNDPMAHPLRSWWPLFGTPVGVCI